MPKNPRLDEALELIRMKQYIAARQKLTPIVARFPDDTEARLALAMAHVKTGNLAMAEYACRKMLNEGVLQNTQFADACEILADAGHPTEAVKWLKKAVSEHEDWIQCRLVLAITLESLSDFAGAIAHAQVLLDHHHPYAMNARRVLADSYRSLGDHALALEHYRSLQWSDPDDVGLAEMVAFVSNGVESVTPKQSFASHVKFARLIEGFAADLRLEHPQTDSPDRRLRVGLVSHDFNGHSVAYFLQGLARSLDRSQFELWAYHTSSIVDEVTEALRPLYDRFIEVPRIGSIDLARQVYADKIDILFDLNGLTRGHRLHTFQLKPAPVQATWIGYPNTTGLRAIDYRIVDSTTDPEGTDEFAAERLVRLDPCFLCYTPLQRRPDVVGPDWTAPAWSPGAGGVRFGCFNNVAKITDRVLDIWALVLAGQRDSTITIKARGLQNTEAREALNKRLTQRGIPLERLIIVPPTETIREHVQYYGQVDIALDTFPYNGTTTTCEALCCGVPVVTYTGDRHAARVSASILRATGLPELVGHSAEDMARIANELATDTTRLHALRSSLAERFINSSACDGPAYAARFGAALRRMWHTRCASGVRR